VTGAAIGDGREHVCTAPSTQLAAEHTETMEQKGHGSVSQAPAISSWPVRCLRWSSRQALGTRLPQETLPFWVVWAF